MAKSPDRSDVYFSSASAGLAQNAEAVVAYLDDIEQKGGWSSPLETERFSPLSRLSGLLRLPADFPSVRASWIIFAGISVGGGVGAWGIHQFLK